MDCRGIVPESNLMKKAEFCVFVVLIWLITSPFVFLFAAANLLPDLGLPLDIDSIIITIIIVQLVSTICLIISSFVQGSDSDFGRAFWFAFSATLIVLVISVPAFAQRDAERAHQEYLAYQAHRLLVLPDIWESPPTPRVDDTLDMRRYQPFRSDNALTVLPDPPTVYFTENFPRLDGATAAFPVFAAVAQALYVGLNATTVQNYVQLSTTDQAYERLIRGEIDIFFGAQPSQQQIRMAEAHGVEFTKTPLAREAFVFFVHNDNPVYSLTVEQIRQIYQRQITNWQEVGGHDEHIRAFQRPANSGSQTIMQHTVMGSAPMKTPLLEERTGAMGHIIDEVLAIYRNYLSAIGYSFRYFVTDMRAHDDIRLLKINGIAPTPENIQNGSYPFIINVYAVTAGTQNQNAYKLIDWLLSEQGQGFIALCGVIPVFGTHTRE